MSTSMGLWHVIKSLWPPYFGVAAFRRRGKDSFFWQQQEREIANRTTQP